MGVFWCATPFIRGDSTLGCSHRLPDPQCILTPSTHAPEWLSSPGGGCKGVTVGGGDAGVVACWSQTRVGEEAALPGPREGRSQLALTPQL